MADRVFFPDYTAEVFPTVLKISFDESLEILLMRGIDICIKSVIALILLVPDLPVKACGVKKASSFGAILTTGPYLRSAFSIAQGYLPEILEYVSPPFWERVLGPRTYQW